MSEDAGSQELVRVATAYLASVAFAVTFLVATFSGADGTTSLLRGVVAILASYVAGHLLVPPAVDAVLSAMARDEARRQAEPKAEEEQ